MAYPKVRDITLGILECCGITAPPVEIPRLLGYFQARVQETSGLTGSALLKREDGWIIKVGRELRDERRAFRIAHELGHIWWSDPAHHLGDPDLGGQIEHYCSKFASLILCPHQWFVQDAPEADYDLFRLKKIYASLSHEGLAIRASHLTALVVTIFDNGKLYRRFGSPGLAFPAKELKMEREVYEEADLYGAFREGRGEVSWGGLRRQLRVRAYPVFSPGFRRIILLSSPSGMSQHGEAEDFESDMPYPFPEY